jgi:hypothetical protein
MGLRSNIMSKHTEPKDKTVIGNLVEFINRDYRFVDNEGQEMRMHANDNLNGWEIWLYRVNGGGVAVMLTQYEQIPGKMAILILKMLLHDVYGRTVKNNHYTVMKRV